MLTEKELQELDVPQWRDLKKQFQEADLLLGNGFPMNLADQLAPPTVCQRHTSMRENVSAVS